MHPRLEELFRYIEQERANLRSAVDAVPPDKHATPPEPGRWTVVGVLEHLAIIENRITGLLRKRADEARAAGIGRETDETPILPTLDLERFKDRTTRLDAPAPLQPSGVADPRAAWAALDASRASFRAAIAEADGLALGQVFHPHMAFGPLDMYTWIGFVGAHEARHADQIREIGASLAGAA